MATSKLFTVVGVSTLDGEIKVRFANDVMRVKHLAKKGHKNILMIELPWPMLKLDAAKFLKDLEEFQGVDAQSAICDYLATNDVEPKEPKVKATKEAKPAKVKQATDVDQAIDAALADVEDQPF